MARGEWESVRGEWESVAADAAQSRGGLRDSRAQAQSHLRLRGAATRAVAVAAAAAVRVLDGYGGGEARGAIGFEERQLGEPSLEVGRLQY
eukprot:706606-Prymnesium_polylepis.3